MIEILPPLKKYKYDTWRILSVKCYSDNSVRLWSYIRNVNMCLEKTILSKKIIDDDLSRVKESATKSTYNLGIGFKRCEDKGKKSAPKFIPISTYHKEEETIKFTKAHYPSNPKPYFNPKRDVKKETPKPRGCFCLHVL
jgi:hypothetical protein